MELNSATISKRPEMPELPLGGQNQEFREVVEKSKKAILESTEVPPVKRGRGRPRKIPVETPQARPQVVEPVAPPPDISKFLVEPIRAVSKLPASKYGIEELAFTVDEAQACAESLNQVLQAFAPSLGAMSPKTAAVVAAFTTFGSIGFTKYQIYLMKRPKPVEPEPVDEIQTQNAQSQDSVFAVHAADAFRRA